MHNAGVVRDRDRNVDRTAAGPQCQFASCDNAAVDTRDHPTHGLVDVCGSCARLFDNGGGA